MMKEKSFLANLKLHSQLLDKTDKKTKTTSTVRYIESVQNFFALHILKISI